MRAFVGVDVSGHWLDVALWGEASVRRLGNDACGWQRLVAWLNTLTVERVVLEATGRYDRGVLKALHAAGLPVCQVNPRHARRLAQACGSLEKTDRIDAQQLAMMASMGEALKVRPYQPKAAWQERLAAFQHRRDTVQRWLVSERQRYAALEDAWLRQQARRTLTHLERQLALLDKHLRQQLADRPELAVLRTIKGIGDVTCATLAALLPELGHLSGKAIAKLVGVAPLARDSGSMRGTRSAWGGRRAIRQVLYMAALTAIRYEPRLRDFYQRLRQRGKAGKVAIVATMRKMLVILNARVRQARAPG
jgi:transposase